MLANDIAIGATHGRQILEILFAIRDVPGHPRDVFWLCAGAGQHRHHVLQRLPDLANKVVVLESLVTGPADLTAAEDD